MNINKKELHEIIKELKEGKQERFQELYEKYNKLVYAIAFSILKNKEDSEDIVQSVFIKMYQMEKEKLPEINETSWLYTVVKNKSIDFLRKNKKETSIEDVYDIIEETDEIKAITEKEYFNSIINKLNETEKQIVTLKIITQMSFREIAQLLNLSIGAVSWKYYQSLHTIKALIANVCIFVLSIGMVVIGTKEVQIQQGNIQEDLTKIEGNKVEKAMLPNSQLQEQAIYAEIKVEEPKIEKQKELSFIGITGITIAIIATVGIFAFTKTLVKQKKRRKLF